jgi:hypothetical protein
VRAVYRQIDGNAALVNVVIIRLTYLGEGLNPNGQLFARHGADISRKI